MKYTLYPQPQPITAKLKAPILTVAIIAGISQLPWLLIHAVLWGVSLGELWARLSS